MCIIKGTYFLQVHEDREDAYRSTHFKTFELSFFFNPKEMNVIFKLQERMHHKFKKELQTAEKFIPEKEPLAILVVRVTAGMLVPCSV